MPIVETAFPFVRWFKGYSSASLRSDLIAGVTVALVLIPQSMAYAQLAGLPAYYGLYAALLPPLVAALFGSSPQLATGPVAVVSLMTAASLAPLATVGSETFITYAIMLALLVGIIQFALGALRLGMAINFLSHPVVSGFTNAAALIIATSQLSKVFGVYVEDAPHHYQTVIRVIKAALAYTHWPTVFLAVLAFAVMMLLRRISPRLPAVLLAAVATSVIAWATGYHHDHRASMTDIRSVEVTKKIQMYNAVTAVLAVKSQTNVDLGQQISGAEETEGVGSAGAVALEGEKSLLHVGMSHMKALAEDCRQDLRGYLFLAARDFSGGMRFYLRGDSSIGPGVDAGVWRLLVRHGPIDETAMTFRRGGAIVGQIPAGLPGIHVPRIDWAAVPHLLPMAMIISILGFMEAISIGKAMAIKTGKRLDPNQELIGQGLANIVGSTAQSYAVSGSFSRSAVNLQAGAVTGLSNVFSSGVVVLTLLFLTPLLYYLPEPALAAIIMMAVFSLIRARPFVHAWKAQRYDGVIGVITFAATLLFAPHLDRGIMIGLGLTLLVHLIRDMKPRIALLALHPDGTYRNRRIFQLAQCRHIAVVRYQGSLVFANADYLEEQILEQVADMPELKHVLIVGNGINELDASGEQMLSVTVQRLRSAGYDVSFSGLNDFVLNVMRRTGLYDRIGEEHMYRNATRAIESIWKKTHELSQETECPLIVPVRDVIAADREPPRRWWSARRS
ncbi:MAG: SulP family inorganic anion transporter [Candidatus Zixiibacteriota bacterium]